MEHYSRRQDGLAAEPAAGSPADFAIDSYDDDLGWILEKLTDRSGGSFGLILRFVEGEPEAAVLARCAGALDLPPADCRQIEAAVRPGSHYPGRALADEELLHHATLGLQGAGASVKLLYLRFAPAPGVSIVAAVCRPDSSINLLHDMVARRLQPVLARYVRLWWLHRTERRRAAALQGAMDLSDLGIVLLDRRGHISFANRCVTRLMSLEDGLRRTGDTLGAACSDEAVRLQAAVQHAIHCNRNASAVSEYRAPTLSLRRNGKRALILTVASVDRPAMDPADPAVVVYVLDPEHDVRDMLAPVFRMYRLTPAEARLVSQLVSGASLTDAAAGMHVGLETARTYLKQVFGKTATNRQSELIRVMLASAARSNVGIDLTLM